MRVEDTEIYECASMYVAKFSERRTCSLLVSSLVLDKSAIMLCRVVGYGFIYNCQLLSLCLVPGQERPEQSARCRDGGEDQGWPKGQGLVRRSNGASQRAQSICVVLFTTARSVTIRAL